MASVTIPGANSSTIHETFGNTANAQLATQIRDALVSASLGGRLTVTSATGGGLVAGPPSTTAAGGVNELVISGAGSYTIPAGSAGAPDYVVVIDPTIAGGVTIHGAPNSSILGGNANVTIVDPAAIALSEQNGNALVTITGAGDVLAGNNQNDTLTAAGVNQSISGGTGSNAFILAGANDTISAQGNSDTIFGGPGSATIQIASTALSELVLGGLGALSVADAAVNVSAATGDTIFGGDGFLNVTTSGTFARIVATGGGGIQVLDAGTSNTVDAGIGSANVQLFGTAASVAGGFGALFVSDNGISDTITAGSGFTSVHAATSDAFVQGGAGLLNFVGGAGDSTIVGGSGAATIIGGTGNTTLYGGAGQSSLFKSLESGTLDFFGVEGNDTIDARLSTANNRLFSYSGNNLLIGGAGNDVIAPGNAMVPAAGSDTLLGGGGQDLFVFWSASGGSAVNDFIGDFSAIDSVVLSGYGAGEAGAALAGAVTSGNSTTITLSDQTRITFTGVTNVGALTGHINSN